MNQSDWKLLVAVFLTSAYFSVGFLMGFLGGMSFPMLTVFALVPVVVAFLFVLLSSKSSKK